MGDKRKMTEEKYGDSYGEKFRQYEDKIKELEKTNEALKGQMSLHEGLLWNDLHKLEKENAELKKTYRKQRNKRIDELQKENAELKSEKGCESCTKFDEVQLTKAKELLKEFMQHYKAKTIYVGNMQDLLEQSEQFISEVEK